MRYWQVLYYHVLIIRRIYYRHSESASTELPNEIKQTQFEQKEREREGEEKEDPYYT